MRNPQRANSPQPATSTARTPERVGDMLTASPDVAAIRKALRFAFPGIVFTVTITTHDGITTAQVTWPDQSCGPRPQAVERIIQQVACQCQLD